MNKEKEIDMLKEKLDYYTAPTPKVDAPSLG